MLEPRLSAFGSRTATPSEPEMNGRSFSECPNCWRPPSLDVVHREPAQVRVATTCHGIEFEVGVLPMVYELHGGAHLGEEAHDGAPGKGLLEPHRSSRESTPGIDLEVTAPLVPANRRDFETLGLAHIELSFGGCREPQSEGGADGENH